MYLVKKTKKEEKSKFRNKKTKNFWDLLLQKIICIDYTMKISKSVITAVFLLSLLFIIIFKGNDINQYLGKVVRQYRDPFNENGGEEESTSFTKEVMLFISSSPYAPLIFLVCHTLCIVGNLELSLCFIS